MQLFLSPYIFKRSTVGSTVFHDGSKVLSGFTLSEKPVVEERWFKMPDMPAGWQPDPRRVWEVNKENIPKREVIREPMAYSKWKSSGMTAGEVRNIFTFIGNITNLRDSAEKCSGRRQSKRALVLCLTICPKRIVNA